MCYNISNLKNKTLKDIPSHNYIRSVNRMVTANDIFTYDYLNMMLDEYPPPVSITVDYPDSISPIFKI